MAAVPELGRASKVDPGVAPEAAEAHRLYERYSGQILGFCLHQLGNREEAEDATQTTFLNAFRGLKRGISPDAEQAWLYKIAHNVCLTRRRSSYRRGRVERASDIEALQDFVAAPQRMGIDELIQLQEALAAMPASQRQAILLREWRGFSYREIADELEMTQAAVETLIFRARRSLVAGLEQPPEEARKMWKRLRHGFDVGSLVAVVKGLVAGGAAVKAVATATAVGTVTVVAAVPGDERGHPPAPAAKDAPAEVVPAAAPAPRSAAGPAAVGPAAAGTGIAAVAEPVRLRDDTAPKAARPVARLARTPRPAAAPAEPAPARSDDAPARVEQAPPSAPEPAPVQAAVPPPAQQPPAPVAVRVPVRKRIHRPVTPGHTAPDDVMPVPVTDSVAPVAVAPAEPAVDGAVETADGEATSGETPGTVGGTE